MHQFDNVSVAVANDHRNVLARRNVVAWLEIRQVLVEIEPKPNIREFTGKEIVTPADGSQTYRAVVEGRQSRIFTTKRRSINPASISDAGSFEPEQIAWHVSNGANSDNFGYKMLTRLEILRILQ